MPGIGLLAHAPHRELLAASGWEPSITIWNYSGATLAEWAAHEQWVLTLAFSPDEARLASGSVDHSVRIWDLRDIAHPGLLKELGGHDGKVIAIAWSPDGRWLATASSDGGVRLWDAASYELCAVLRGHRGKVNALVFAADSTRLLSGGDDGAIQAWTTSVEELRSIAAARVSSR